MARSGSMPPRNSGAAQGYNGCVPRFAVPAVFALATALAAQTGFFPLQDVKPGMRGTGRTVFSGSQVDEFQVEILGVLDNVGPKESLILARLSGGPLEHTGVMAGMSGSPVYIDGKLVGAVAMAFPFAKDPIAGIRPIQDMMRPATAPASSAPPSRWRIGTSRASSPDQSRCSGRRSAHGGYRHAHLLRRVQPRHAGGLRAATARARPGAAPGHHRGRKNRPGMGNPADLKPGSMISVELMAGDLSVGADGTVTYIDGNRVWAFGHRFLAVGATALPFARAEVIALLPNLNTSFKLASAREWMGTIYAGWRYRHCRRAGQARRPGAGLDRRIARRPRRRVLPTCRWSTTRCFRRCCCRWPSFRHRRHRAHRGRFQHARHRRSGIPECARAGAARQHVPAITGLRHARFRSPPQSPWPT
jgi:hypothetical protein